jgi:phospholipase C
MDTRRDFIKKASMLSGMAGLNTFIPASIQKALSIEAAVGTTWKDAEHIVILMQENRSFDHCFGTLKGVRGFNDPRAIQLPNGNPVWLQSNLAGETYAPFRLDIKDTKATWMSSLPHSWDNQVNARNDGRFDEWINVKKNSIKEYSKMPLTMGYYDRQDIPFYYELADAFTVCDQHFCSALTGTNPNRLYFWTGTVRAEQHENSRAHVWNEDMDYETLHWKTFPEILEENDISWKFYQNEVSIDVGFKDEQDPWLSNFQDNPLEFFSQYNVKLHGKHLIQIRNLIDTLPAEIAGLESQLANMQAADPAYKATQDNIAEKKKSLQSATKEIEQYNRQNFDQLSARDKELHRKAFVTNANDPDYHSLEEIVYEDAGTKRQLNVPKGDLLHQFREDVTTGKLPTVSWLAAPENLSDHPSSAWYGAWYVSEVMDILTKNPEVWKKTIFILTYDENDGYFDHVPPFVAPHSGKPETGKVSEGLDTRVEFVTADQAKERKDYTGYFQRESSIGLGFRVPLIVASPWSRGGYVNSEIFDHTSTLQFLEKFLTQKTKKPIEVPDISDWRRVVSGDLTSIFQPAKDMEQQQLNYVKKDPFLESIYTAKFKKLPTDYKSLSAEEIEHIKTAAHESSIMPVQEKGIKPSNGLCYQLYVQGKLNEAKTDFEIHFEASDKTFGKEALGSPFNVYAPGKYLQIVNGQSEFKPVRTWAYAVKSATSISDSWKLTNFENNQYHLRVYGPNGFFREFKGSSADPQVDMLCGYQVLSTNKAQLSGNIEVLITNYAKTSFRLTLMDNAYNRPVIRKVLNAVSKEPTVLSIPVALDKSHGWYDFTLTIDGYPDFAQRFTGRVETGRNGYSDPSMGGVV